MAPEHHPGISADLIQSTRCFCPVKEGAGAHEDKAASPELHVRVMEAKQGAWRTSERQKQEGSGSSWGLHGTVIALLLQTPACD